MMVSVRTVATVDDDSVTDLFCGAGGTAQGARDAGLRIRMAVNHWELAVKTHATNFRDTDHDCANISLCDPRRYPRTRILLASPECTNHSLAKGITRRKQLHDLWGDFNPDPAAERSRATMWDVPRFAEYHGYDLVIVENVVEARQWVMWDAWLLAMHALGYEHQCVYLNSMHAHPTPQSRDRLYVVFWRKGLSAPNLELRPSAYCPRCETVIEAVQSWKRPERRYGRYRQQYVYRCPQCAGVVEPFYYAAANAIDWSLPIERIGDRKHPLKPKTLARIQAGLERFGREQLLISLDQSFIHRNVVRLECDAFPTQTTSTTMGISIPPHVLFSLTRDDRPRSSEEPWPTQTGTQTMGMLAFAPGSWDTGHDVFAHPLPTQVTGATPFLVEVGHGGPENAGRVRRISDALPTQHTLGGVGLVVPLDHQTADKPARGVDQPLPTQTTRQELGLAVAPFLVSYYGGDQGAHAVYEALGTQSTHDRHALVQPSPELPAIDDCGFRVLKPNEIQAAMAFGSEYVVLGTNRDKIRQLGNAVTPPATRLLVERCLPILAR